MKYRKKPVIIEAVQYLGANCPPGCEKPKFEIVHSVDGRYFYISGSGCPRLSRNWMSHEEFAEQPATNGFDSWVQITKLKENNRTFYRKLLPFATYEVKSGKREPIDADSELFKDYASCERWEHNEIMRPRVYIKTLEGRMEATIGDWIIKGVNGEYYPCKPEIFEATYEAV